jgi:protein SCO1/2
MKPTVLRQLRSGALAAFTAMALGGVVRAADDEAALAQARAAVAELGRINGLALACAHKEVVARAKTLMIARVAKTRELGALFEEQTSAAFTAQAGDRASCPGRAPLAVALEAAALRLPAPGKHQILPVADASAAAFNPRYLLRDMNGRAVMDSDFHGRFQLLSFGYTYCPDICPTTLVDMAEVLKQLGGEAQRLQAIFVSVDPERDTPEVLKKYTAFFDPRILGASGSPELVRRAADNFKVRYEKVPGSPGTPYAVDHSAGMVLLGPDGGFIARFAYAAPATEIAQRIRAAMAAQPPRPQ